VRRRRARRRTPPGVEVRGRTPRIGAGVQLDVGPGARLVLGDGCVIGDGCRLLVRNGTVELGDRVVLGDRCTLLAHASITVGSGAVLGDGALALDFDHAIEDVERPVRLQPLLRTPVAIGAGARIGHGACLLRGVVVGAGAEVGEHAVVTRSVPAGTRVEGIPARPVALPGLRGPTGEEARPPG
jgi:acetyltransferase-like isoleucine patch superfamily enzyme